jgi:hypothetical protein
MDKMSLDTIQWTSLTDIDEIQPIDDRDYEVLDDLRSVLAKHGYTHRFGICLLHKHFDLGNDEVLMETTDASARISTLAVQRRGEQTTNSIETMWKFSDKSGPLAVTKCVARCHYDSGHRQVHSKEGY